MRSSSNVVSRVAEDMTRVPPLHAYHATDMWMGVLAMVDHNGGAGMHYIFCMRLAERGLLERVPQHRRAQRADAAWWFKIPEGMTATQVRDAALVLLA
jgi:hypothetical protein